MPSDVATNLTAGLSEAGDFLRSRRERLRPSDVGLPNGSRRRTPGLRREEVAMLADVGTTWYTWLEQGRDIHPSNEVLTAVATALQLNPVERRHLFVLHGRSALDEHLEDEEQIDAPLRRMLDSLTCQPAYVRGRRWDILAWNEAADIVYGPYARLKGDRRNSLSMLFVDQDHRRLLVDWEEVARAALAMFRADHARYAGNPDFQRLVSDLTDASPEFAQWWPQRAVACAAPGPKHIDHQEAGKMLFEYSSFGVGGRPGTELVVFTPLAESDTADKLRRLTQSALKQP